MIHFDSDHIIVGYIKQLLKSFNLPVYKVYTREHAQYAEAHDGHEISAVRESAGSIGYIKGNVIQKYIKYKNKDGSTGWHWVRTGKTYCYDQYDPNYTINLPITNNIYDSATHEYLGKYLRFQRDYNGINLMPLYNCFSNSLVHKLTYNIQVQDSTVSVFDADDTKYKIYSIPVKLFQNYTIALDCPSSVELCCGIYGAYQNIEDSLLKLPTKTYQKYNSSIFGQPQLYKKLFELSITDDEEDLELLRYVTLHEEDLRLFIKLPANNTSTIIVLEGDYLNWNDKFIGQGMTATNVRKLIHGNNVDFLDTNIKNNRSIINFEQDESPSHPTLSNRITKYISALQLLLLNTQQQYPFADKLIEYLTDNVITPLDDIPDNIRRLQTICAENDNKVEINGVWTEELRAILYDFLTSKHEYFKTAPTSSEKIDTLGYGDKIAEKFYKSTRQVKKADTQKTKVEATTINTLRNVDIYGNTYKNLSKGGN